MKAFSTLTGIAVPFLEDDVNTDQIAPIPNKEYRRQRQMCIRDRAQPEA